jgi:glycerol-3-phosphate dehydrogenase (NAD(P)+)
MTQKDFWPNSKVAVIGGGSWGTVLAQLAAPNCREVRVWVREEDQAAAVNSRRRNEDYLPEMALHERVHAMTDPARALEGAAAIIWALPSDVCRDQARRLAPLLKGDELILHATKGIEPGTLKRVSQVLREELPTRRIGVISGPNLAGEIARGEPAATVVASVFAEVVDAGIKLLQSERFRIYPESDVIGVEWAGTLKNILAIAAGALDAMKLGWNARAMLITRGLAEMVRFGEAQGARKETFLGLAGVGDLMATASSPLSRNYRVGMRLAQGEKIDDIQNDLGMTTEGVRTTRSVWEFASERGISMPITEGVYHLIQSGTPVETVLRGLMNRPQAQK